MIRLQFSPTEAVHPDGRKVLEVLMLAKDLLVSPKQMRSGDYAVRGLSQSLGFEYKTAQGLYTDVVSERLDLQAPRLALDYDIPIIVTHGSIHGDSEGQTVVDGWQAHNYPYTSFQRKLLRLGWSGVTLLWVRSTLEAANTIIGLARSLEKRPLEPLKERPSNALVMPMGKMDRQRHAVAQHPGIGAELAERAIKAYGSLRELYLAWTHDQTWYERIEGIGKGKAATLARFLDERDD